VSTPIPDTGESQTRPSSQGLKRSVSGIVTCSKGRRRDNWGECDDFCVECSVGGCCRTDGVAIPSTAIREVILEGENIGSALSFDGRLQVAQLSHFNGALSSLGNISNKRGEGVARGREIQRFR
jgi:hypothetical protein